MKKIKVAVGLSGGVDSAVAAYLIKKQGFNISGVYLNCFDSDIPGCRGEQDRQDAVKVALHLKIPFQVLDFRQEYKAAVIDYFKKEYLAGRTPNPDVICNRDIKFGLFLDWAVKARFDYVATGHYAKLVGRTVKQYDSETVVSKSVNSKPVLQSTVLPAYRSTDYRSTVLPFYRFTGTTSVFLTQPKDLHKDQTYFLWAVPRQKFCRVLFPLADFPKQEVRSLAKFAKIPVAAKPDSTGICFIGEVKVEDFLKRLGVKEKIGEVVIRACNSENIVTSKTVKRYNSKTVVSNSVIGNPGYRSTDYRPTVSPLYRHTDIPLAKVHVHNSNCYRVIGSHHGVAFYTIGQRHGFEVNRLTGQQVKRLKNSLTFQPANLQPFPDRPPLYVIEKDVENNRLIVGFGPETYRDSFEVSDCNWLVSEKDSPSGTVLGRTVLCRIRHGGNLIPCRLEFGACDLKISLSEAQRGIAPGQSAVFYSKTGLVLGGGVIQ